MDDHWSGRLVFNIIPGSAASCREAVLTKDLGRTDLIRKIKIIELDVVYE